MLPMIKRARQIKATIATQAQVQALVATTYGDTVPSKPQNYQEILVKVPEDRALDHLVHDTELIAGDYGTIVVHSEGASSQIDKTSDSNNQDLLLDQSDRRSFKHGFVEKSTKMWAEDSTGTTVSKTDSLQIHDSQSTQASSPSLFEMLEKNPDMVKDAVTKPTATATIGRKGLSIQDKLWSICAAGNTIPIPYLKAIDISPVALVSENRTDDRASGGSSNAALEAVKELFSCDGQMKKSKRGQNEVPLPPGVYQRLTTSPTLLNLAQALAYHKTCYEDMPLQELQAAQEQQTIQNLCDTLRTILRL